MAAGVLRAAGVLAGMACTIPLAHAADTGDAVPVALVIGNTEYGAFPKLQTCEVSANLVASVLSRAGFKVIRQTNSSNARLGTAIANVGEEAAANPGARTLIYVCGYAVTYSDRLFLVPAEARLERDADVLSQGIVARLLMGSVAGPTAAAGLVLMDVAVPPGKGKLEFEVMVRPADAAHGGLAAASLPTGDAQRPGPLAGALADMVASGRLEVGAALAALPSQSGVGRSLQFVRAPADPSWLLGGPPGVAAVAARPPVALPPSVPLPAVAQPTFPPVAPPAAVAVAPAATLNPAERRRVQLGLQKLGYFRGRVTGAFGPDSVAAIRQFQKESGVEATGRLTSQQVDQLLQ